MNLTGAATASFTGGAEDSDSPYGMQMVISRDEAFEENVQKLADSKKNLNRRNLIIFLSACSSTLPPASHNDIRRTTSLCRPHSRAGF